MLMWSILPAVALIGTVAADDHIDHVDTLFSYPINLTVPGKVFDAPSYYETGWMINLPSNDTSFGCFDNETTHQWGITEPAVGVAWWNVTIRSLDAIPYSQHSICQVQGIADNAEQVTFYMADSGQNDFIRYFGQSCLIDRNAKRMGCCWSTESLYWRAPPRGGEPGKTRIWMQCPRADDIKIADVEDTDRGPDAPKED